MCFVHIRYFSLSFDFFFHLLDQSWFCNSTERFF
uniref:Uncharacterized protein n=1 Tax=Rhizophora mucronata TaxID=61149 RepID=A0A2P2JZT2_RHIMU